MATQLSESEQVSQFQQLFNQPRFAAVFQFYSAITKLKAQGIRDVIARMVKEESEILIVALFCYLHEARDSSILHVPPLAQQHTHRLIYRTSHSVPWIAYPLASLYSVLPAVCVRK